MLKKNLMLFVALLAAFTMTAQITIGAVPWGTDLKAAQSAAAKEKRPIVMLFTGSDWCPYCVKLERNFLSKRAFQRAVRDKAVLLYLDFPRQKEQAADLQRQNRELAQKYGVRGFPTTVVLGADGEVKGQIVGAPNDYLTRLAELLKK